MTKEHLTMELDQSGKDYEEDENYKSFLGGDNKNPIWEEHMERFNERIHPHLNLIKEWILAQDVIPCAMDKLDGDMWCNRTTFVFSDGKKIGFSFRGWGDIAQAAVGKREGYMQYYGLFND